MTRSSVWSFAALVLVACTPHPQPTTRPHPAPPRPATTCTAPAPTTADSYNTMLAHTAGWLAGDGGATTLIPGGRRAWAFGDSLLTDGQLHHSALVIQTAGCARSAYPDRDFLPAAQCGDDPSTAAVEAWCWGGPVGYGAGLLWMLAPQVAAVPGCTGAFCFRPAGVRLFGLDVTRAPTLRIAVPLPESAAGVLWDSALLVDGATAYVYGYRDDGDPWTFGYDAFLASAPVAGLADRSQWRYRTDTGWSAVEGDARPVLGAAGGPETGFSVQADAGRYVLTSTADGGLGHVVTEWSGPAPWGPWTAVAVADWPDTADHMWYLPQRVAGTGLHVISQSWPRRPLSDIPAAPGDFRVQVF